MEIFGEYGMANEENLEKLEDWLGTPFQYSQDPN